MTTISLIAGALTLKTNTFKMLRERSDVLYRGFLVVFLVGFLAGAFAAGSEFTTSELRPQNEAIVTQEALRGFENSYTGAPEVRSMIESYITEGVAMGFELDRLPPNAGPGFHPFARLLRWLGQSIAAPFAWGFLGYLLLGGLLVHQSSRWLGGKAGLAQMLGVSALSFAPIVLDPISSLLRLAGNLSGSGTFSPVESLIGLVVFVWGTVIYVKATAIAQQFSYVRAVGAILLALVVAIILALLLAVGIGALVAGLISILVALLR
jgi:hypothetical protein